MIKFYDLKPTLKNQNYKISREYPRLYRYIKDFILRHKAEIPKNLEVSLWAWYSRKSENTQLSWKNVYSSGENSGKKDFRIDINLKQILMLYKNDNGFFQEHNRLLPGKIKGFRKYLLFVILHEVGHYQLKQKVEYQSIDKDGEKREIFADSWAYDTITQGQKDFDFKLGQGFLSGLNFLDSQKTESSPEVLSPAIARAVLCFAGGNKKIEIYHYSSRDFKGYIEPKFFGLNYYTRESSRESELSRSFFYIGKGKENFLSGAKFCYIAEIDPARIYDFDRDIKDLKNSGKNFNEILLYVKKLGFFGISGNNGFKVLCLFKKIKYINKRGHI